MRCIMPFVSGLALSPVPAVAEGTSWEVFVGASQLEIRDSVSIKQQSIPSLGIGLYRLSSTTLRVGSSLEVLMQEVSGGARTENVLMWRMAELDYLLSEDLALSFSGGIARFYREQPSYGYGIGVGMKYQLSDDIYLSARYNKAEAVISSKVPTDDNSPPKNDLQWLSLQVHLIF